MDPQEELCIRCLDYPHSARSTLVAMTQPMPGPRTSTRLPGKALYLPGDITKCDWEVLSQQLISRIGSKELQA
jgi:hypothetical protein